MVSRVFRFANTFPPAQLFYPNRGGAACARPGQKAEFDGDDKLTEEMLKRLDAPE
jgi:hypothetical protein